MSSNVPHIHSDARSAANDCAQFLVDRLREAMDRRGRARLAVSGGNTPKLMFEFLRGVSFPWEHVELFFVDERAVPANNPDSNYRMANEHFLQPLNFPAENVVRVEGELPFRDAAAKYQDTIRERFGLEEGEMPVFDAIHLGMGEDAHTASLFPGEPLILDRTGIAAAVIGKKQPPERITLLPGVLLAARAVAFLIDGADKQKALTEVLVGPTNPEHFPSQLLSRSGKQVDWFVDNLHWPDGAGSR